MLKKIRLTTCFLSLISLALMIQGCHDKNKQLPFSLAFNMNIKKVEQQGVVLTPYDEVSPTLETNNIKGFWSEDLTDAFFPPIPKDSVNFAITYFQQDELIGLTASYFLPKNDAIATIDEVSEHIKTYTQYKQHLIDNGWKPIYKNVDFNSMSFIFQFGASQYFQKKNDLASVRLSYYGPLELLTVSFLKSNNPDVAKKIIAINEEYYPKAVEGKLSMPVDDALNDSEELLEKAKLGMKSFSFGG